MFGTQYYSGDGSILGVVFKKSTFLWGEDLVSLLQVLTFFLPNPSSPIRMFASFHPSASTAGTSGDSEPPDR